MCAFGFATQLPKQYEYLRKEWTVPFLPRQPSMPFADLSTEPPFENLQESRCLPYQEPTSERCTEIASGKSETAPAGKSRDEKQIFLQLSAPLQSRSKSWVGSQHLTIRVGEKRSSRCATVLGYLPFVASEHHLSGTGLCQLFNDAACFAGSARYKLL
eukprot:scaffold5885_cov269-Prasinococcus_capsulatus_cf.AAC.1